MASSSSNGTIWTVAIIGFLALLVWKLWPVLSSMGGGSQAATTQAQAPASDNAAQWYQQGQQDLQDWQDYQDELAAQNYASTVPAVSVNWSSDNQYIPSGSFGWGGGYGPSVGFQF